MRVVGLGGRCVPVVGGVGEWVDDGVFSGRDGGVVCSAIRRGRGVGARDAVGEDGVALGVVREDEVYAELVVVEVVVRELGGDLRRVHAAWSWLERPLRLVVRRAETGARAFGVRVVVAAGLAAAA